jgi:hypothetical protein
VKAQLRTKTTHRIGRNFGLDVAGISWAGRRLSQADGELLHEVQGLVAFRPGDNNQRAEHDLEQGRQLRAGLERIITGLVPADPPPGDPADTGQAESAVREVAGYLHYLLALLEVFTPELVGDGTITDAHGKTAPESGFDQLCLARQTLGADPRWAWLNIELVRDTWGLKPSYPYPAGPVRVSPDRAGPNRTARRMSTPSGGGPNEAG